MILETALIVILALVLDSLLGEARSYHPLAGFGNVANLIEKKLNKAGVRSLKFNGAMALMLLLLPLLWLLFFLQSWFPPGGVELLVLYLAIGRKSLKQHALAILQPLEAHNLALAREKISLIVSRDTQHLNAQQITKASIESIIENSSDAIFAAIFWFLIAGAPGVLVYRLSNTLDAMWGYKNDRFIDFGWAAARFDDVLNWLPARLTVLSFALFGQFKKVWHTAFQQGQACSSINAGPVMAAGACALNIKLGGEAIYGGRAINKPELGYGNSVKTTDIKRALLLVDKTLVLWLGLIVLVSFMLEVI